MTDLQVSTNSNKISSLWEYCLAAGTAAVICNLEQDEFFPVYNKINEALSSYDETPESEENLNIELEDLTVSFAYEGLSWQEVYPHIEEHAEIAYNHMTYALGLARTGLIESATDGSLDSDMNQLDMETMVNIGLEIKSGSRKALA